MTTFDWYQEKALESAQYPQLGANMIYPALGLAGESGEFADKVKKIWRNQGLTNGKVYTQEQALEAAKELSDVLWYVSAAAHELGYSLEDIALLNIEKLQDRVKRGVVKGEGDNR